MYHKVIHNNGDFAALKEELISFRAKLTAKRISELGFTELQSIDFLSENAYVPKESRGL